MTTPDATSIRDAVRNRSTSAEAVVASHLRRIHAANPALNAFHEVFDDAALARAREIDARAERGEDPGPLAGVPLAAKDNIATRLGRTTCSSRILENYRSPFDATVIERLLDAGAVLIGKTNLDEFAMGSSTEHCAWGAVSNPWDPSRVPGGSSGGSAAAVAADLCAIALGSDTGGSIRQPASLSGCVGLKPTYGRVSRYGLVAFGSSLDQIGPLTRSVRDAALVLDAICGLDPLDSTSADREPESFTAGLDDAPTPLRIGVPREYLSDANDPDVNRVVNEAIEVYRSAGAEIVPVELPLTDVGISTYYVIAPAEASSNLARFDGIRYGHRTTARSGDELFDLYARSRAEGFGEEVQRRIMLGTYVLSSGYYDAYYDRAMRVRRLIKQEFDTAFRACDAILGPTSPTPAFKTGELADPLAMYLCDVYTVNANIAGICGVSLPGGFALRDGRELPIGVQLQAPAFAERALLRIARLFERARSEHFRTATLATA
ncbi:MAG: Asp-tRNA(Asn)/Glu-tRNA(Gln) amidotransferase subunit GatA [Phycisphaerae bacterium]|nr:Asp-tRNA(Asn)/Glu-tRNA(Gln) amidotransferase subunit GatA [Phycisphaerae bacterium]